jgi:hypothetical protein
VAILKQRMSPGSIAKMSGTAKDAAVNGATILLAASIAISTG